MLEFTTNEGKIYIKKSEIIAIDIYAHGQGGTVPLAKIHVNGASFQVKESVKQVLKMLE